MRETMTAKVVFDFYNEKFFSVPRKGKDEFFCCGRKPSAAVAGIIMFHCFRHFFDGSRYILAVSALVAASEPLHCNPLVMTAALVPNADSSGRTFYIAYSCRNPSESVGQMRFFLAGRRAAAAAFFCLLAAAASRFVLFDHRLLLPRFPFSLAAAAAAKRTFAEIRK